MNMAVVFDAGPGEELPPTYLGLPVIDGDASDLRFLDPPGVIVGLRAKGKARALPSGGFVRASHPRQGPLPYVEGEQPIRLGSDFVTSDPYPLEGT